MKQKKITANFFWNNSNLSIYEYSCLKSFIQNNFRVNVYSFVKIKLPKGAILQNASKIMKKIEINKLIHQGKRGCLAAFADKFRIELLKKQKGWWFDMDVLCLKKSAAFLALERRNDLIIGLETNKEVNNAVLQIKDMQLLEKISKEILKSKRVIKWGEIGPKLITKVLKENNMFSKAFPKSFFYPINYFNFKYLLLPKYYNEAKKICKDSYTSHNYNEILNRFGIPKNIMPPKGSFLHKCFLNSAPELKSKECLPEKTAIRLLERTNGFKENLKDLIPSLIRSFK